MFVAAVMLVLVGAVMSETRFEVLHRNGAKYRFHNPPLYHIWLLILIFARAVVCSINNDDNAEFANRPKLFSSRFTVFVLPGVNRIQVYFLRGKFFSYLPGLQLSSTSATSSFF